MAAAAIGGARVLASSLPSDGLSAAQDTLERQLGQVSWGVGRLSESVQRSMQEQAAKTAREIAALKECTEGGEGVGLRMGGSTKLPS